jgi:16S rRNA (guanine966-N2)-methyltransferase
VREALFSLVGQDLTGIRVLDAFGGTGLLGLEAWSRGADVVVVECDPGSARRIRADADRLGAPIAVHVARVLTLAPSLGRFHGVLADPPYSQDPGPIVAGLCAVADDWLLLETDEGVPAPDPPSGWTVDRRRTYGSTALVVYRADGSSEQRAASSEPDGARPGEER